MSNEDKGKSTKKIASISIIVIAMAMILIMIFITINLKNENTNKTSKISNTNKINELDIVMSALELYKEDIGEIANLKFDTNYNNTYRFIQMHNGIQVYGGGLIATIENGELLSVINHNYKIPNEFNINAINNEDELLVVIKDYLKNEDLSLIDSYLVIYPISNDEFTLAHLFKFNIGNIIIDDSNKEVLSSSEIFNTSNVINTNISEEVTQQYYKYLVENNKSITQEDVKEFLKIDGKYTLLDNIRNIEVYRIKDEYKQIKDVKFLQENTDYYSNITWEDIYNANTLPDKYIAIKTMQNLQLVYDYYKKEFNFNSIKGNEEYKLNVFTNFSQVENLDFTNNATLTYFNKDDIRIYFGASNLYNNEIEVIAHEYTHGYFNSIIDKYDDNETNAINEAYSDIMGMIIEAYYEEKEIDGIYSEGDKNCERNIKASNITYNKDLKVEDSHEYSMLVSKVAYLMSINEKMNLNIKDLSELWFNSLYKLPKNIVTYDDVERAILFQAIELGYSQDKIREIANIFVSLGYPDYYEECLNKKIVNTKIDSDNTLELKRAINLLENKFGDWKDIKVDYEYMFKVKDNNKNSYYAINKYAHENYMYSTGEWLEKTEDGRYYAGTYYVSINYKNNTVYVGYNPRDYGKYKEGDTVDYFLTSDNVAI